MKVNNPNEKYNSKPNPKLFNSDINKELEGKTYYAYLDTVERINRQYHIRFDCIIKNDADNISIDKQTILDFPSIVIDITGEQNFIRGKFNYNNLHLLESKWTLITTSIEDTTILQEQFFNFLKVGDDLSIGNYNLESITLFRDMDSASREKVNEIIRATTLEESTEKEVTDFLDNIKLDSFSYLNVYNVGQGNCIALVDIQNNPLLYNDVGGGFGTNKKTYPKVFKLCTKNNPPVLLSHWDLDHIQTAVFDDTILNSKWLVPIQGGLSNTAIHIALELQNRGNLICWNNKLTHYNFSGHRVSKCIGNQNNKNNSGLALFINYDNDEYVLLPGDASYTKITNYPVTKFIGLVASHHGSKSSISGVPKPISEKSMLVYSFGELNTYGHPTARNSYLRANWTNFSETKNGNIAMKYKPKSLKCSCNNTLNVKQHF
ncbi:hypothetical protein [Flavobacterium sp.]|uniref:hypothetical protein n=1 Tax=Flavobacterium sp. TaxID=239 RepID=UPI002B4AADD3|nr:hypothetical protein [Flavobacterium sp.]HLP64754.1 hypothetical protein [Flavobacterium sp.]